VPGLDPGIHPFCEKPDILVQEAKRRLGDYGEAWLDKTFQRLDGLTTETSCTGIARTIGNGSKSTHRSVVRFIEALQINGKSAVACYIS
jgi:hypothetical protein